MIPFDVLMIKGLYKNLPVPRPCFRQKGQLGSGLRPVRAQHTQAIRSEIVWIAKTSRFNGALYCACAGIKGI